MLNSLISSSVKSFVKVGSRELNWAHYEGENSPDSSFYDVSVLVLISIVFKERCYLTGSTISHCTLST